MTYSGYIKDHPAYCLDHQCRKFHVLKYIMIERKFQALSWQRKKSFLTNDRKKKPYPSDQVKRQIKYQCWHVNKHTRPWGGSFIFPWGIYKVSGASHVCRNYYTIIYGLAYCIQTQETILELKETEGWGLRSLLQLKDNWFNNNLLIKFLQDTLRVSAHKDAWST